MYTIITENPDKNLREDGKIDYYAFGVELITLKNIKESLSAIQKAWLLTSLDKPVLGRVLRENERKTIFANGYNCLFEMSSWINMPEEEIQAFFKPLYSALAPIYLDKTKSIFNSSIYDEILSISKIYFDGVGETPRRIKISTELSQYLEAFRALNFKLVRTTEKKIIVGKPNLRTRWEYCPGSSPLTLFKANTLSLMLLTQQTTFQDGNLDSPIILDGAERTVPNWHEETVCSAIPVVDRNPQIPINHNLKYTYNPSNPYSK